MARVIFIHGTGVRRESFEGTIEAIRLGLDGVIPHQLKPCFWGETLGAMLGAAGYSIPSKSDSYIRDPKMQMWAMLDAGPWSLVESALVMADDTERDTRHPQDLLHLFSNAMSEAVRTENLFHDELARTRLGTVSEAALNRLLENPSFRRYVASPCFDPGSKIDTLARTYLTLALHEWETRFSLPLGMTGEHRQRLEDLLVDQLGGQTRSASKSLTKVMSRIILPIVSMTAERYRGGWSHSATPVAGDILRYFARPRPFRQYLEDVIDESTEDTVLLSHSLGALIAFDSLCERPRDNIKNLITVGAQVGYLYEIDALPSLVRGAQLPAHFPKWDNILDPRDFLAYRSSGFFDQRVTDHRVDNGAPFPRCHESYFENPETFNILGTLIG